MTRNEDLQLEYFVARPVYILPIIKPTGFPAPSTPVTLFRLCPSGYVASNMPVAGGPIIAVPIPRNPQRTSNDVGLGTKDVMSENKPRSVVPRISWILRPKRSAVFPKKSTKDPFVRLVKS